MPHRIVRSAVVAVLGFALLFVAVPVVAQPGGPPHEVVNGRHAAAHEVLVKFRAGADSTLRQVRQQEDVDAVEPIGSGGALRLRSRSKNVHGLLTSLAARGDVEYVEPNFIVYTQGALTPNDQSFPQLWGLQNTGQSIGGVVGIPGVDIKAPDAWGVTTGSASHVVGVIDTGVNYNHADLAANMWTAPAPFSVTVGGLVITCDQGTRGFNAILNTCDPMDNNSHGTHVAGTIGATGNNTSGVAGVNWTASIMGLKFLGANGSGTIANAVKAIDFAVQVKQQNLANVRVLSNSWSGGGFSLTLFNAIKRADSNGIVFVAAAGNAASNNDAQPVYPASYDVANVVAVAATDNRDNLAGFSSYGATSVDLGAPGVSVYSTTISGYAYFSGTSMATPHVSGAAALVLAACPTLDTAGVISAILNNVDPVTSLAGKTFTGGRLNVHRAVQSCVAAPPAGDFTVQAGPASHAVIPGGAAAQFSVTIGSVNSFTGSVQLSVSGLPAGTTASFNPAVIAGGTGASTLTVTPGANTAAGNYTLTITGTSGSVSHSASVTLVVSGFSVSVTPGSATVAAGASTAYSVTVTAVNGFTGVVSLSAGGLPTGATATFSPSSVTNSGSSTMTISTSGGTPKGSYTVTVTGTSAGLSRSGTATLVVQCKGNGKCK